MFGMHTQLKTLSNNVKVNDLVTLTVTINTLKIANLDFVSTGGGAFRFNKRTRDISSSIENTSYWLPLLFTENGFCQHFVCVSLVMYGE